MVKLELKMSDEVKKTADRLLDLLAQNITPSISYNSGAGRWSSLPVPSVMSEQPTEEEKAMVEKWMETMDPVITQEAMSLVKQEISQMMRMGGNVKAVAKALKEGKKPKLVRKKEGRRDPLFIQIGDGVEEPIEEIHLFG